jgi:uncharacterized protein
MQRADVMAKKRKNKPSKFKQFIAKVEANSEERTVTAVISTGAIDRDKEVLVPKGADLENFRKNPVVLWAHDHSIPAIGKALHITVKGKKIIAKVKFATTPFADEIFSLFKDGILNAFSVGFMPTKSHSPTPKDILKNPELVDAYRIFDNWELLEFSPVNVPANPEALATAVKTMSDEAKAALAPSEKKADEDEPDEDELDDDEDDEKDGTDGTIEKAAVYLEAADCILVDGNYSLSVTDGEIDLKKLDDEQLLEIKEVPIIVQTSEIVVEELPIVAAPYIDLKAEAVEVIKTIKGKMY